MDDGQALGARLAHHDECALEAVYEAYGAALLAYLTRLVGADEAEDVLQRTLLDAWRHANRYELGHRFNSWLFTIAHHRAVDAIRRRRDPAVDVDSIRDLVGEDGRDTAERYARAAEVRAALRQLPEHERSVLAMAYFADLTQRDIAARLHVPLGTVKARASRGMHHLAAILGAEQDATGGAWRT